GRTAEEGRAVLGSRLAVAGPEPVAGARQLLDAVAAARGNVSACSLGTGIGTGPGVAAPGGRAGTRIGDAVGRATVAGAVDSATPGLALAVRGAGGTRKQVLLAAGGRAASRSRAGGAAAGGGARIAASTGGREETQGEGQDETVTHMTS